MIRRKKLSKRDLDRLASGQLPELSEEEIQSTIVDGLRAHGYLVLITSRRAKKCWKFGQWPMSGKGDGASKGLGDLIVRGRSWPRGVCLQLEVKRPGPIKWSSTEQRLLAEIGNAIIVQGLEEALAAAGEISAAMERI